MSELKIFLDLRECRIYFETLEGNYEGIVKLVCPITCKIIIEKVILLPEKLFMGVLHFGINDIINYKLLELTTETQKSVHSNQPSFTEYCNIKSDACVFDDDDESIAGTEDFTEDETEEEYIFKLPDKFEKSLSPDSVILTEINDDFYLAIQHVKKQVLVGLSCEGPRISRFGVLTWLNISTPFCTFMFDIEALKEVSFDKGLKGILESSDIIKIIHDCRNISDCLYHLFKVKICNIFDTQVADFIVNLQNGTKPKKDVPVNSVDICLHNYLEIPEEHLYVRVPKSYKHEIIFFGLRPPRQEFRDYMIKNVVYLRMLHDKLNKLLLSPFEKAVNIYLDSVKSLSNQELLLEHQQNQLPIQFGLENLQIVKINDCVNFSSSLSNIKHSNIKKHLPEQSVFHKDAVSNLSTDDSIPKQTFQMTNGLKSETVSIESFHNSCDYGSIQKTQSLSNGHGEIKDNLELSKYGMTQRTQSLYSNRGNLHKSAFFVQKTYISSEDPSYSSYLSSTSISSENLQVNSGSVNQNQDIEYRESSKTSNISNQSDVSSTDISSDLNEDPWERLRSECAASHEYEISEKNKLLFVPAGKEQFKL